MWLVRDSPVDAGTGNDAIRRWRMGGRRVLKTSDVTRVELRLSNATADAVYALAEEERTTLSSVGEKLIRAGLAAIERREAV